jgi:uncharacterized protein (TIGR00304 family)
MNLLLLGTIIAVLLIFLGIIFIFIDLIKQSTNKSRKDEEEKGDIQAGGVIFIGPIPIVFGSSREVAKWMLILAVIIAALLIFLYVL